MNQDLIHEPKIPEHWLYWSFLSPNLIKNPLTTIDNQIVNIINPGQLNYDNGPDILNAVIEINGIIQKGDIEFHLTPGDWFKHGHHEDLRYRNLILHIIWKSTNDINSNLLQRFPHIILSDQINIPFSDWFQQMNLLDQNETVNNLRVPKINSTTLLELKFYGQHRFKRKVERFKCWLEQFSFEDIIFISLAEALGYSKNKFPFRQLLWENPPSKIFQTIPKLHRSVIGIWVYLAICSDFLNAHSFNSLTIHQNPISTKIYDTFTYFNDQGVLPNLKLRDWYFSRVRPVNSPIIRLAALAQIIYNYQGTSLFKTILNAASERKVLKKLLLTLQEYIQFSFNSQLVEAIKTFHQLPIQNHYTIGKKRNKQFILNSVLPILFLWAERTSNKGFQEYIEGLNEEFPVCDDTGLIQNYQKRLFKQSQNTDFNKFAIYQQGLFELLAEQKPQNLFEKMDIE